MQRTVTKDDLIRLIKKEAGLHTSEATAVMISIIETIKGVVIDDYSSVYIKDFGRFYWKPKRSQAKIRDDRETKVVFEFSSKIREAIEDALDNLDYTYE
jgi:nucleoid DNA-binding protein